MDNIIGKLTKSQGGDPLHNDVIMTSYNGEWATWKPLTGVKIPRNKRGHCPFRKS